MEVRMKYYIKRKDYQVIALEKESCVLSNKARFITELLEDTLDLRKKKTVDVSKILKSREYDIIEDDEDYKYLVRLPMDSVTEENIEKIMAERDRKNGELEALKKTSEVDLWMSELDTLRKEYLKIKEKMKKEMEEQEEKGKSSQKPKSKPIKIKKTKDN
tara:strand:- start:156 stop:635 length:480 start_codon:yes stop_codon:yes gene_type:complete